MELVDLISKSRDQTLEARSVEYLVNSREFEETWAFSSLQERNLLSIASTVKVRLWMDSVRRCHIEILRTRELKSLARTLRIINYSRMTRNALQESIWEYYENKQAPKG